MQKRKKTIKEIKKALPNLEDEKVEVLSMELDRILALKKLFQSEGGEELINVLRENCARALRRALAAVKNAEEKLMYASLLDYSANMDLLSQIQDISLEAEIRQQLDEAVKEVIEQQTRHDI
jgi:hypothetical protein